MTGQIFNLWANKNMYRTSYGDMKTEKVSKLHTKLIPYRLNTGDSQPPCLATKAIDLRLLKTLTLERQLQNSQGQSSQARTWTNQKIFLRPLGK